MELTRQELDALKTKIEGLFERIRRLDELPEHDKMTKYKKAIGGLFAAAQEACSSYLGQMLFGGFRAPVKNPSFLYAFRDSWLFTDEFVKMKSSVKEAIRIGQADTFFNTVADMREISRVIVLAFGGKELPL